MATASAPKKSASVVLFHYGNSQFITFFQETLKLKKAMEGYDYKVLLKHNAIPSAIDLSERDEAEADIVDVPTQANLFKYIKEVAQDGYMIDLFIFARGATGAFLVSRGRHDDPPDTVRSSEITSALSPASTGLGEVPIRMIWSTLCYGATLNQTWQSVGAKVVAGSRTINFFPNQFGRFINEWNKGNVSFRNALTRANTAASRTVVHTAMLAHARLHRREWGGCPFAKTILGEHPCAKDYFTTMWYEKPSDYLDSLSGKENMNHGSEKVIAGDGGLTKRDIPTWNLEPVSAVVRLSR